jgi:hypothetical protein
MKTIPPYDIIFGVNDTSHFVHTADERRDEKIFLKDFFIETKPKRRWSIVNPGYILSNAYSYFVFAQENRLLDDFLLGQFLPFIKVTYPNYESLDDTQKSKLLKRRIRNAIAHCRYKVEIRTDDGKIRNDGDLWFVFNDEDRGKDKITMEISLPSFGNLIESAGKYCISKLHK